jgi:hypothetical protein
MINIDKIEAIVTRVLEIINAVLEVVEAIRTKYNEVAKFINNIIEEIETFINKIIEEIDKGMAVAEEWVRRKLETFVEKINKALERVKVFIDKALKEINEKVAIMLDKIKRGFVKGILAMLGLLSGNKEEDEDLIQLVLNIINPMIDAAYPPPYITIPEIVIEIPVPDIASILKFDIPPIELPRMPRFRKYFSAIITTTTEEVNAEAQATQDALNGKTEESAKINKVETEEEKAAREAKEKKKAERVEKRAERQANKTSADNGADAMAAAANLDPLGWITETTLKIQIAI